MNGSLKKIVALAQPVDNGLVHDLSNLCLELNILLCIPEENHIEITPMKII